MERDIKRAIEILGEQYAFDYDKDADIYAIFKKSNQREDESLTQGLLIKDIGYNVIELKYCIDDGETCKTVYKNSLLNHNVHSDTFIDLIKGYEV